jgi:ABC-type molybdenum transport system ATPase subunit/photorepair protein PhrA
MDEPLTSLDSDLKSELLELITGVIAADATAVVYVTHEEDEAQAVGGTRLYLRGGRLVPQA